MHDISVQHVVQSGARLTVVHCPRGSVLTSVSEAPEMRSRSAGRPHNTKVRTANQRRAHQPSARPEDWNRFVYKTTPLHTGGACGLREVFLREPKVGQDFTLSSSRPSQSIPGVILRLVRSCILITYIIYITVSYFVTAHFT